MISDLLKKPIPPSVKYFISAFLFLCLVVLSLVAIDKSNPGKCYTLLVGDWLINYSGGFIRRGLTGSILIGIAHTTNLRPELMVAVSKIIFYGIIYLSAIWIFLKTKPIKFIHIFLLVYQTSYMFPLLDLRGGGRKEIILLAIFSLYALKKKLCDSNPSLALLALLLSVLTLVHDSLFWFYPVFLLGLSIIYPNLKLTIKSCFYTLLPSGILTIFIFLFGTHASPQMLDAISNAIDPINYKLWNGAISYVTWGIHDQYNDLMSKFNMMSIPLLALGISLAYLPIYLATRIDGVKFFVSNRSLSLLLLVSLLIQTPLVVAMDWGRWVYLDSTILSLAYLTSLDDRVKLEPSSDSTKKIPIVLLLIGLLLTTIFIFSWRIHHCCATAFEFTLLQHVHWFFK